MKLPEAVIDHLRSIDIPYGYIVIHIRDDSCRYVDVKVEETKRLYFGETLENTSE